MFARILLSIVACLWFTGQLPGQTYDSANHDARPKKRDQWLWLDLPFKKIQFTDAQKTALSKVELELELLIDQQGNATLLNIKGTMDPAIMDSLHRTFSRMANDFNPKMENGKPIASFYSIKVPMPLYPYESSDPLGPYLDPGSVQSYTKSGKKLDFLIGLVANGYLGTVDNFKKPGGGLKIDIMYTQKNVGVGITTTLYSNGMKKDYTISTSRDRLKYPPTILVGLALNKLFYESARSEFIMQIELNYAAEEVTPKLYSGDPDNVVFKGWSPGLVANYLIRIGKDKFGSESLTIDKQEPVVYHSYLNLHAAMRPLYMDSNEASGFIFELGVSYRFSARFLSRYILK